MKKVIAMLMAAVMVVGASACSSGTTSSMGEYEDWENTSLNGIEGGAAYYNNGFLYYTASNGLYEYDLLEEKEVKLEIQSNEETETFPVNSLIAEDDCVIFTDFISSPSFKKLFFDTKQIESYFSVPSQTFTRWYLHENTLYGLKAGGGEYPIWKITIPSGEIVEIGKNVNEYCVEDDTIYYITVEDQNTMTLYRKQGTEEDERIDLEINPVAVASEGDRLVLANIGMEHELYEYSLKTGELKQIEAENAESLCYQIIDGRLYYVYWPEDVDWTKCSLYVYDFETGENKKVLEEEIQHGLCVFSKDDVFVKNSDGEPMLIHLESLGDGPEVTMLPYYK